MGAGLPRPPKLPKNGGLVKIAKGLAVTPAPKTTKWTVTGTLDDCVGLPNAPETGTPILSGAMALHVTLPPGGTCDTLVPGAPTKVQMVIKWRGLVGRKLKTVAKERVAALASFSRQGTGVPVEIQLTTPAIADTKSVLLGKHLVADIVMDETQSALDAACAGDGLSRLHFTGVQGLSTITVLP
jgi:hypothetical protein